MFEIIYHKFEINIDIPQKQEVYEIFCSSFNLIFFEDPTLLLSYDIVVLSFSLFYYCFHILDKINVNFDYIESSFIDILNINMYYNKGERRDNLDSSRLGKQTFLNSFFPNIKECCSNLNEFFDLNENVKI